MLPTPRVLLLLTGLYGALGVVLGAFGAHALKARLTPDMLAAWKTGVEYHLWHTLALGLCGALALAAPGLAAGAGRAGLAFALGILLFSGSLYALALGGPRALGPVTPLGGLALIAGWVLLAVAGWRAAGLGPGPGAGLAGG